MKVSKNYIIDREMVFEIIIAKGRGKVSDKLSNMFWLLSQNVMRSKQKYYHYEADYEDVCSDAYLKLLTSWKSFKTEYKSIPYFTEVVKRSAAQTYNEVITQKFKKKISLDSYMEGSKKRNDMK